MKIRRIKINRGKTKGLLKRKRIPKTVRLAILAVITLVLIFSAYTVYAAYKKPTTIEQTSVMIKYGQKGTYDYIVYLKNNAVYNKTKLFPGEGSYFKQIVNNISASFTYTFNIDKDAEISGSCSIQAKIQTDQWTKTYTLVPSKAFTAKGTTASVKQSFPINYSFFENILSQINSETGITASSPSLIITSNVFISAKTSEKTITDSLQFPITISLNEKIIKISDTLSQYTPGEIARKVDVFDQGVVDERNNWTIYASVFVVILVAFGLITTNDAKKLSEIEETVRKIKKKYGEIIVDVDRLPIVLGRADIEVATLDDLIKISEELGKPVIHYTSNSPVDQEKHTFHVLDKDIHYEYTLKLDEK